MAMAPGTSAGLPLSSGGGARGGEDDDGGLPVPGRPERGQGQNPPLNRKPSAQTRKAGHAPLDKEEVACTHLPIWRWHFNHRAVCVTVREHLASHCIRGVRPKEWVPSASAEDAFLLYRTAHRFCYARPLSHSDNT